MVQSCNVIWRICLCLGLLSAGTVGAQTPSGLTVADGAQQCLSTLRFVQRDPSFDVMSEGVPAMHCMGTVTGVSHVLSRNCSAIRAGQSSGGIYAAAPPVDGVTPVSVFVDWARRNPGLAGAAFEDGLIDALVEAFPC
jgi:hypothetical protein